MSPPVSGQWFDWQSPLVPRIANGRPDLAAPVPRTAAGGVDLSGLWVPEDARGSLFDESKIRGRALDAMAEAQRRFYADDPRFHCNESETGQRHYSGEFWSPSLTQARATVTV